jgi:hypothetical protein
VYLFILKVVAYCLLFIVLLNLNCATELASKNNIQELKDVNTQNAQNIERAIINNGDSETTKVIKYAISAVSILVMVAIYSHTRRLAKKL